MYTLIGLPGLFKAYTYTAAFVAGLKLAVSYFIFGLRLNSAGGFIDAGLSALGTGILVTSGLVWACQTPIFPLACRKTPLRLLFPPIDGEWLGELDSNFAAIAERDPELSKQGFVPQPTEARLLIKARLLTVSINLKSRPLNSDSPYLESDTLIVGATREGTDRHLRLTYVYRAHARTYLPTDSELHHGAALLDMEEAGAVQSLRGTYWTDRNWRQARNTAGIARFERPNPLKAP